MTTDPSELCAVCSLPHCCWLSSSPSPFQLCFALGLCFLNATHPLHPPTPRNQGFVWWWCGGHCVQPNPFLCVFRVQSLKFQPPLTAALFVSVVCLCRTQPRLRSRRARVCRARTAALLCCCRIKMEPAFALLQPVTRFVNLYCS